MYVDSVQRTDRVTAERIVTEAVAWGVARERATETVDGILENAAPAVAAARDETDELPDAIVATVEHQLTGCGHRSECRNATSMSGACATRPAPDSRSSGARPRSQRPGTRRQAARSSVYPAGDHSNSLNVAAVVQTGKEPLHGTETTDYP